MARVLALVPDLLFGSNALGALQAGGHQAHLAGAPPDTWPVDVDVVVVDLTTGTIDPAAVVAARREGGPRLLGVYAHVEPGVRDRALAAGFDRVVPRSRFHREGAALVTALAAG